MDRTGRCLCGAVSYVAKGVREHISMCHCTMCLRWSGGPLTSFFVKDVTWTGEDHIRIFKSSDWAERAFCSQCGSNLYYRMTASKYAGTTSILFGTLDDTSGMTLDREWFIDNKPDGYTIDGDHQKTTEAEALAMLD